MSNGNFVFKPAIRPENSIRTLKNRVIMANKNALSGTRPKQFWPEGMFEIVHLVQKVTGDCSYD
jgi:hypothetical protein